MRKIEVKKYYPSANPIFRGNPLIEAWPQLTEDSIGSILTCSVPFEKVEKSHSAELRMDYTQRLLNFYLPLDQQVSFIRRLWSLICTGYVHRMSLQKTITSDHFYDFLDSIEAGTNSAPPDSNILDSMWSALLIGTPGCGKSSIVKRFFRTIAPGLLYHKRTHKFQLLHVYVEARKNGSAKALAQAIFHELVKAAKATELPFPHLNSEPRSLAAYQTAIEALASALEVGIIVIDEIQHLSRKTAKSDEDAMKFLTGFINHLGVPILMIGTWEALPLLTSEMRIARRAVGPADGQFVRMQLGDDWRIFVHGMFRYQFTTKHTEPYPQLTDRLYFHSAGIPDITLKLFVVAQLEAISSGEELITIDLLDRVAEEHFAPVLSAINMLRDGRRDAEGSADLEPVDLNKHMKAIAAEYAAKSAIERGREKDNSEELLSAVINSLLEAGIPDVAARQLAESSVSRSGSFGIAEHVSHALSKVIKGPKPTRSRKQKQIDEVDKRFQELDELDIRKIVYLAARQSLPIEKALSQADLLCNPFCIDVETT